MVSTVVRVGKLVVFDECAAVVGSDVGHTFGRFDDQSCYIVSRRVRSGLIDELHTGVGGEYWC